MFVTENLKLLYTPYALTKAVHSLQKKSGVELPFYPYRYWQSKRRHVYRRHIPNPHCATPVLTCTRDPFSQYLSHYKFEWWKKKPENWLGDVEAVRRKFPSFPDLSFSEFCYATNMFNNSYMQRYREKFPGLGVLSVEFLCTYAKDRDRLSALGKDFDALADALWSEIKDIIWLRTPYLNSDLHSYLLSVGECAETIEYILSAPRVNAAKAGTSSVADVALRDYIAEREALLIEMNARIETNRDRTAACA